MSSDDLIQKTFDKIIQDFKAKLGNDEIYVKILNVKSIEDVYSAARELQSEQAKNGRLRYLSKIEPYLERLRDYAGVVETLVQAKPDILALIWGPIKLLLQWSAVLKKSFDAIVDTTAEIGDLLPEFTRVIKLFEKNTHINDLLALFFQDILDFYIVALQFFSKSRWKTMFEAVWPSQRNRIQLVITQIGRHTSLMRNEARLQHIEEEHDARLKAIAHFEQTEKALLRDEHDRIKTAVSPVFYDDQFYRYHSMICKGTIKWLSKDTEYKKWRDQANTSTRLIWFQGIPGSGKTVLAAAVTDDTQSGSPPAARTIFAFLSHNHAGTTTALSVVHSLIFQLTEDDDVLQTILCHCTGVKLKKDINLAVSVLTSLLSSAGRVVIVLDGLDEISQIERQSLLDRVLELSKACSEVKVMISSRNEVDIARKIGKDSAVIRVDDRNSDSIQAFVVQKSQEWLQRRDFNADEKTEIEAMLAPIAINSQGMFLYAKIIFTYIERFHHLDTIRAELRVLPKDLHDAYSRILARVNSLPFTQEREHARRVLGWIGCSPAPMTVRELEQALAVNIERQVLEPVRIPVSIVEICGPIVEVVDGYAQFVHFTVKEYLFDLGIEGHIDMVNATLDLTKRSIWYLCQEHYRTDLETKILDDNLIHGRYRLHYYVMDNWTKLLVRYITLISSKPPPEELFDILLVLEDSRANYNESEPLNEAEQGEQAKSRVMIKEWPEINALLNDVVHFQKQASLRETHLLRDENCSLSSPLTITLTAKAVYLQLDHLLCETADHIDGCACGKLEYHYGPNSFKCGFLGCSYFRQGFNKRSTRDSHEKNHDKPWKCDDPACEYADIGFLSKGMKDHHMLSQHKALRPSTELSTGNLEGDELQSILFGLVFLDKVQEMQDLLPSVEKLSINSKITLLKFVAASGSATMMEILYEPGKTEFCSLEDLFSQSTKSRKLDTAHALISINDRPHNRGMSVESWGKIIANVMRTNSPEFLEGWKTVAFENIKANWRESSGGEFVAAFYTLPPISATKRSDTSKQWLASVWSTLHSQRYDPIRGEWYHRTKNALVHVAETCPSVFLAKQLLRYGYSTSYIVVGSKNSPMSSAAIKSAESNARLMEFLLYHGADPDPPVKKGTPKVSERACAKNMKEWLGVSYEELVERVQADRARGFCPPQYRLDVED